MKTYDGVQLYKISNLLNDIRDDEITVGEVYSELEDKKLPQIAEEYANLVWLLQKIKHIANNS